MGASSQIPKEVLREIVSYLDSETLVTSGFTSHFLNDPALLALYGHVDLHSDPDLEDELPRGQDVKSLERQKRLIVSFGA
jgi:hypothetical protein